MADRKISDLTALTTPASGDYVPIVDISETGASSKNKRITIEELMRGVPDGTAAAPGIAFETDPNTGIYSPGADQLAVATNGTGRLFVTNDRLLLNVDSQFQITDNNGLTGLQFIGSSSTASFIGTLGAHDLILRTNSTERARIDSSGRLLVGTSASISNVLEGGVQIVGTASDAYLTLLRYNTGDLDSPGVILGRSKSGTKGTNTIVAANDRLGDITFTGADGSAFISGANISAFVDGTPGANDMPSRLVFSVTADGASIPTEALRISNDRSITVSDGGNVVLGTTTGTKIGTGTTQKIGFYNATPVVQPTAVADATDAATVITQLNALLAKLRTLGIIAT